MFSIFKKLWCIIYRLVASLFTSNNVSVDNAECIYEWKSAYRIEDAGDCTLVITVRIRLNPDADVTAAELDDLRDTWEQGIQNRWSDRFKLNRTGGICDCCEEYTVKFDAQFVDSSEHHVVRVRQGPARSNMTTWDTDDDTGTAAHEFGHMLGHPDEYADPNCPDRVVTNDGSIMRSTTGDPRQRHYAPFAQWISRRVCCQYTVSS